MRYKPLEISARSADSRHKLNKNNHNNKTDDELKKVMSLFNFVTGFLAGVYGGLYAAKHYNVPDVPEPAALVDKVKQFIDQFKKDGDDEGKK